MERARGNGLPTPTRYAPAPLRALTDDAADDRGRPLHLVAADVEMGDGPQPPRTERDEQLTQAGVLLVPFGPRRVRADGGLPAPPLDGGTGRRRPPRPPAP